MMLEPLGMDGIAVVEVTPEFVPLFGPPLDGGVRVFVAVWD